MTESFSNNAQWIFAGIGASIGGRGAVVAGRETSSIERPSIIDTSLATGVLGLSFWGCWCVVWVGWWGWGVGGWGLGGGGGE